MKSVSIHTVGCKLNYSESSYISRQFTEKGVELKPFGEKTDIFILNTCTVTAQADRECRQLIRSVLRNNPDTFVVITGCYAQLRPNEIAEIDGVDLIFGSDDKFRIIDYLFGEQKDTLSCIDKKPSGKTDIIISSLNGGGFIGEAYSSDVDSRTRAFLKIQDGCDYNCSFCTIPLARGKSRSLALEKVIENAQKIIDYGYKEIILTGVNIGDYSDESGNTFFNLLCGLNKLNISRIRISSIEPNLLNADILNLVKTSDKFCNHFHIPLQSGSPEILNLMRRRYNVNLYEELINKISEIIPEAGIGVDVIIGFPGETDYHFNETYDFINSLTVSYLHVFSYSERPDTRSVGLPMKVSTFDKKVRSKKLRELSEVKKSSFYKINEGKYAEVLFETEKNGYIEGWTGNYVRTRIKADVKMENEIFKVKLLKSEGIKPVECEIIK
ncbi:MAG: tRNA (N(6)-L-threonylcarbamoyladenosine(37)-C(2))-methylthiotransferase MtaB [Ignavibacteria bacterium]|nr:tRNA (N(6)-L-threonylcarbamoyladenosine(37)-C(2))-methylthiotransferase MtaB [Ignavibacteria bacterium]